MELFFQFEKEAAKVVMPAELMPFMDMHTSREEMSDRKHA